MPHAHNGPGALRPAQWKQRRGPYLSASARCPCPYFPAISRNAKRYEKKDADLPVVKKEKKDKKQKHEKDGHEKTSKRKKKRDASNAAASTSKKPKKTSDL